MHSNPAQHAAAISVSLFEAQSSFSPIHVDSKVVSIVDKNELRSVGWNES